VCAAALAALPQRRPSLGPLASRAPKPTGTPAGYFQHDGHAMWQGALGYVDLAHSPPDMGPARAQLQHGVMTIGAVPWIVNFNVPLQTQDLALGGQRGVLRRRSAPARGPPAPCADRRARSPPLLPLPHSTPPPARGAAREVAREISERGGGLARVEAMALQHQGVVEVACNLLDYRVSGPQQVEAAVRAAAAARGAGTGGAYCIGKLPEEMVALAGGAGGVAAS
jgi:hypothetical protein